MALNMEAIGKKIGPTTKEYSWQDPILYALGVGAGFDELDFVYEKNLKVIPTFSIAAIFEFLGQAAITANINLAGVLHGGQDLIFHNPIPTSGKLITEGRITNYFDKGPKGAIVVAQSDTYHSNGQKLFTNIISIFSRFDGNFGGPDAPPSVVSIPEREPDFIVDARPSPDQPLLYRLSGDFFPLHVDPDFAQMAGFVKPIMHGLCTHGYACRALMAKLTFGRPELVRRFTCRFTKPLYPGDPIRTLIWKTREGEALWQVVNAITGEVVIDLGVFEYGDIPKDEVRFDGRVAIVTGAGGSLGRVYALELARRGARVLVNDFGGPRDGLGAGTSSPADEVVAEIRAQGGLASANYDSISSPAGGENIVKTALERYGRVDILINNAGILRDKTFLKMEPANWQGVLDVHLHGTFNVTQPAFRAMKEQGYGRIIFTTSAAGLYGNFGQTNYSAAKMALVGFMNALRLEGAKYNIKVNTVAPVAASRLMADILPAEALEQMKPELVAPLVLYLCSEKCDQSGGIYNAGMGRYNRAAVMTAPGVILGDGTKPPTAEEVAQSWERIKSIAGAKEYEDLGALMNDIFQSSSGG